MFIGIILSVLVFTLIFSGEVGEKTTRDFDLITSQSIDTNADMFDQGDATLSYRLWLLIKTNERIIDGDFIDKIFGLGLFSEISRSICLDNNWHYPIVRESWGGYGLFNPDISYSNILAYNGYLGSFLYLSIFFLLGQTFYSHKAHRHAMIGLIYILFQLFNGFNGSSITYPLSLFIPILFYRQAYIDKLN